MSKSADDKQRRYLSDDERELCSFTKKDKIAKLAEEVLKTGKKDKCLEEAFHNILCR